MIDYSIDENSILHVNFLGEIDFKAIAKWLAEFSEIQNLPSNLYLIYDLRNADLKLDPVNLVKVAERTDEATEGYEHIRTAFLIEGTKLKEYSSLFTFLKSNSGTIRKAYSDFDAAYKWLLEEKEKLFDAFPED
jgi:hypothetical protein